MAGPTNLDIDTPDTACRLPGPRAVISQLTSSRAHSSAVSSLPAPAARANLLLEASLRSLVASVKGSWASVRSGLNCWAAFMSEQYPDRPHFPASSDQLCAYSSCFANGGTLDNYIGHLRLGHQLQGYQWSVSYTHLTLPTICSV